MKEPKPSKTLGEQYAELNKKYLITKMALELACEELQFFDYGYETKEQGVEMKYKYFMGQAKEGLENMQKCKNTPIKSIEKCKNTPPKSIKKCKRSKSITIKQTCNDNEDEILKKIQELQHNGYKLREMYKENDALVYRFLENKRK